MDMEKGIGTILREAREAKQLTISQVEEKTNIRANYLEAIEKEEFSKTPGEVFVKGIIRSYGNFLGLDGNALVGLYKAQKAGMPLDAVNASEGVIRENNNVKVNISLKQKRDWGTGNGFSLSNFKLPVKQLAMGLGAVALLGFMYFAVPKVIAMTTKESTQSQPVAQVQTNKSEAKEEKPVLLDKVEVVVEAQGKCWTEVHGDGKEIFAGMLTAGDKKVFNAKDKLVIKYGNIGVVKTTVNGKPVDLQGEHGVATKTYAVGQPIEADRSGQEATKTKRETVPNVSRKPKAVAPVSKVEAPKALKQDNNVKVEVTPKVEKQIKPKENNPAIKAGEENKSKSKTGKNSGGDKR